MSPLFELSLQGFLLLLRGLSAVASDVEDEEEANFYKNRQLYGQQTQSAAYGNSGDSYQNSAAYGSVASYQSSSNGAGGNTLMSREICKGRIGYVADTTRNCEVFYNCFADGTVTTSTCPGSFQFDETSQCCKMPHDVNCAGLLDGGVGTPRPAIECAGKRGFFADYTSNCRVFYFCEESGRSRQLTCPDGLIFNELIGCCDVAQKVRCGSGQSTGTYPPNNANPQVPPSNPVSNNNNGNIPFCRNRPAGFYANLNDCSTYYYCQGGGYSGQTLHCPSGQAFNEVSSSCDNDLSRCYGTVVDSSVFDCSGRNGWYAGNDPECTTAYFCNNRVTYLHTCQQGLRWNPITVDCGLAQQVQCRGGQPQVIYQPPLVPVTSRPVDTPSGQYPPSSYGGGGGGGDTHFIPQNPAQQPNLNITFSQGPNNNPQGPQTYPSTFPVEGPGGGNGQNQNPGDVPPSFGDGNGHNPSPGYVPVSPGDGYNQNPDLGDTTGDANANPGLGIDNSYDCSGKIGYYAIQEVGCAQFVYCSPEGIARKFDCPSTLLFNNSLAVCDWPQNVQCGNQPDAGFLPSTQNPPMFDCRGKDGFYADQSRGGRVFYLCHADGIKYQYVCPANLVFNERTSVCDWPDYMKDGGFVEGTTNGNGQGPSSQWIGEPLDCRLRPAGFYANPVDNTIYARCTPDGTFVPMQCPQTTVFDQALGQCVFPFQLGQGGQTLSSYEGRNPQIPTSVTTTSIYPRPTSTQGGIDTTHYYQPNTVNPPIFAVQNGFYGQGGNSDTHSPEGGQPNFAVQTSFYGQEGSGGPGLHNNEVPNYAVQSTFYGQAPSATHTPSSNNNNNPNSDRPNYAVQNTFYGQMPGANTQDNSNNHDSPNYAVQDGFYGVNQGSSQQGGQGNQPNNQNERPTFLNQGTPRVPNYAVQGGPGYANFPQEIPDSYGPGNPGGGSTSDNGQTYFQLQPTPGYVPQNNVHYTNQYDHQNEHPSFLNQRNPQVRPQVYGNTDVQTSQQQPPAGTGGRQPGITIGITITNHGTSSVPYGTTAPPTTLVICLGRTGIFADRTSQCRSYTICRNDGVGETRTCPDNQVFNEQISACDNPQNTNCFFDSPGIVQPSVPVCLNGADRPNTFLPDVTQSCTTFYSCEQNGQGTQFRCPPGLQFNSKINACDDPRSCNCVAANGGTINIRIPVTTSQIIQSGEAYGPSYNTAYQQDHGSNIATDTPNQNMNLDITVHRTKVGEYMPLVRGYDEALYADASVAFGRLPTFYADDENGSAILNMTDMANDITPATTTLSAQEQLRAASQQEHAALMQMAAAESVRLFAKTRPSIPGVTNNSLVRTPEKPRSKFRELRLGRDPSKPFGGVLHALATANSRSMRRKFTR